MYDVLSYPSRPYYCHRDAFKTLVGDGEGPVPVLHGSQPSVRLCRRITRKRKFNETDIVQEQPSKHLRRRLRGKCKAVQSPVGVFKSLAKTVIEKRISDACAEASSDGDFNVDSTIHQLRDHDCHAVVKVEGYAVKSEKENDDNDQGTENRRRFSGPHTRKQSRLIRWGVDRSSS